MLLKRMYFIVIRLVHIEYIIPSVLINKKNITLTSTRLVNKEQARTYLQLPLRQWGAGNVYFLVLFSWKVNIAENPIAVMGL